MDVGELLVNLTATDTVIGIGGQGDPTSSRVPDKLFGTLVPDSNTYVPINYPAGYDLGPSRDAGVPVLDDAIGNAINSAADKASVVGYSEGTLVAEQEKRNLQGETVGYGVGQAPAADQLHFTQIASPFAGNGGLFARFPETPTFLIVDNMGPAQPSRYDTDYVAMEYDPYADFPAYANPLSLANAALGVRYAHPDTYYDNIDPNDPVASPQLGDTRTVDNGGGGTDTYTLYRNPQLPLLGPVREGASLIGAGQYVEPELGLVEPTLRVLVDMGYTDRTNADPATPTPFSLITPPENIIGAGAALPGAVQEGIGNFIGGSQAIAPLTAPSSLKPSNTPAGVGVPTGLPAVPIDLPKLPVDLPKLPSPPKVEPPTVDTPKLDALEVPKLPKLPTQSSPRGNLSNLGSLANTHLTPPKVLAGGAPSTQTPSFGAGRPAGLVSGALKNVGNLTGGLTGKKAPAATP
jgi:hypothetical protein